MMNEMDISEIKKNLSEDDKLALTIANKTVVKLAKDWQGNPCDWHSEMDIHAELRSRLATAFSILGLERVIWITGEQTQKIPPKVSRVECAPTWGEDKPEHKPDIVIWGEKTRSAIPDDKWPALWACEIKYVRDTAEKDIEKLHKMIQKEDILFGCSLSFQVGKEESIEQKSENNVDTYKVWVPVRDC